PPPWPGWDDPNPRAGRARLPAPGQPPAGHDNERLPSRGCMLKPVVDVAVPVLVVVTMIVVGLGLTPGDFRRVARAPRLVAAATAGQALLLPLAALGLVRCLALSPPVATGVLLVAACPAGSMANLYAYLARAHMALAVSLTAVSCLAAVLTMPLALAARET